MAITAPSMRLSAMSTKNPNQMERERVRARKRRMEKGQRKGRLANSVMIPEVKNDMTVC